MSPLIAKALAGPQRQAIYDALIRRTTNPEQVADIVRVTWAIEVEEAKAAEEAQAAEMKELLAEADQGGRQGDADTAHTSTTLVRCAYLTAVCSRGEGAAETLRSLVRRDHDAANALLDRLEESDPGMAGGVLAELRGRAAGVALGA
jgi:hypothetical protein